MVIFENIPFYPTFIEAKKGFTPIPIFNPLWMPQQVLVRVRDISKDDFGKPTISHGLERVITYRSFSDTKDKFQIIEQVTEDGLDENGQTKYKAVPGNPNLPPEYRTTAKSVADHADDTRVPEEETFDESQSPSRTGRRGRPKSQTA